MEEVEKKVREHYQLQTEGDTSKVQVLEESYEEDPEEILEELEQEELELL